MLRLDSASFAARRARLLQLLPEGAALLLPTNPELLRSGDSHFPFRPHSDFFYVTGLQEPEAWALLKRGGEDEGLSLFVLPKDPEREVWTGIRVGVEGAKEEYGADRAWPLAEFTEQLGRLLADVEELHFAFGRHPHAEPRVMEVLATVRSGRKAALGPSRIVDPSGLLAEMRLRKGDDELALMRQGAVITHEAHVAAMEQVRPGMKEYEIQALVEYTFRRRGAWGWAYPSIVGGGANACILHYVSNNGTFGDNDLMLIDAGAEVDGYATDVTRTSPVTGRFTPAQKALYELVLASQVEAVEATRPGANIDAIHDGVVRTLTAGLIDLGLLTGTVDDAIEEKHFRRFYMHRTSHWLGLDVHDVGRYLMTDGPRPLEPGMVITIEPGLYVSPDDEAVPAEFRGIGIRIEDDVLVTADGHENLTAAIPKTVADIEALRS